LKKRICDHAIAVLKRTGNAAVMWGDIFLLHMIAQEAGLPHDGPRTEARVLSALSKTPGRLTKKYTRTIGGRRVLVFRLERLQHE
jgi:hypothetical protein